MKFYKKVTLKNGQELTIRNPEIEDAENFANYINKMKTETKFITVGEDDPDYTVDSEIKFIQSFLTSPNGVCLMAELDGKIAGNSSIGAVGNKQKLKHRSSLGIGLLKEFWGKGIAGKLMIETIEFAKQMGYEQIELGVIADNDRAYDLYKSFGFIEQGVKKNAFKHKDGTYADEIMMVKFLKDKHGV